MSVKNKLTTTKNTTALAAEPVQAQEARMPHSLRLRLVIWYGLLLAVALVFFAVLVLVLVTDATEQSVNSAVQAEARITNAEVRSELQSTYPYWPTQFHLNTIDVSHDLNIIIQVVDVQGKTRYQFNTSLTGNAIHPAYQQGATPYTATVDGGRVRVLALPINAPVTVTSDGKTSTTYTGPLIGTLFVAKPLADVDAALFSLQTLLLLSGIAVLIVALIGGWLLAANVLRPLSDIVKTARAIAVATAQGTRIGNLSHRVRETSGHDEMAQVVNAFNEMLADLESATQVQKRFIADASHELRAPLTTIQGNLAFLQRHFNDLPADERQIMLSDAHGETLRLAKLVEELLILARADANTNKQPMNMSEGPVAEEKPQQFIELDHVVLHLVRQLRGRLSVDNTRVKLEVGHIEPMRVQGDEESLRRVLLILLDNAIKYTRIGDDTAEGRVIVSLERSGHEAGIHVRDTGIGIDAEDLPHIFERFYRADRARSRQGTGLGLSIAWTLVEQLSGRITVESEPGKGSTFSVWLPLR